MIVILESSSSKDSEDHRELMDYLSQLPGIALRTHKVQGSQRVLTEIYLIGDTSTLLAEEISSLPGVDRVVRVSEEYRILGRHKDDLRYNGPGGRTTNALPR